MGMIGCSPGFTSKPAAKIFSLKYFVFTSSLSRSSVVFDNKSNTAMEAPAIDGAKVFENK